MTKKADQPDGQARFAIPRKLIGHAAAVLGFERLWPTVVWVLCCIGLFLAASWLGLWLVLPPWAHVAALALFAAALVGVAGLAFRPAWPRRADVLARLDRDTGLPHRPISAADDVLANPGPDPATRALWDLHRRRLRAALRDVRVARPSPRMVERDRFAVRGAVLVALVAAAFVAGPEKYGRLAAAFSWTAPETAPGIRVDAWIDPPAYTGKPPLVLLGQSRAVEAGASPTISAPVGSTVVVRLAGTNAVEITGRGALKTATIPADPQHAAGKTVDKRFTLAGDGELRIAQDGGHADAFSLKAIPDTPPRIRLKGSPKLNARGTLVLSYTIEDDYGVVGAEAHFVNPVINGQPVTGRALVDPPHGDLALPAMPGGLGDGTTALDLSDHPWAGAQVSMTLAARDEGGNVGESVPTLVTLPEKPFNNPLARALVEQRRNLVLDPDHRATVATALDALQIAPEVFDVPPGIYLGLQSAQLRLAGAKTDPDLVGVADYLWQMALQIENGDLDQLQQDLRAAEKALRDALDRGASPDEIKRLTQALREQMNKVLSEMMTNADKNQAENNQAPDQNSRTITDQDLKSMMDKMEDAARRGDMAEAQRLLDQLNTIMENLKTAKRGGGQNQQATREMNRSMNDLNRMMQEQGDVRDKTFQQDQQGDEQSGGDQQGSQSGDKQGEASGGDGQQPGSTGGKPSKGGRPKPGFGELRGRQQALGSQLDALQRKLRGLGMKGEQGFADAQEAMKQAENALGKGDGPGAVEAQGRALEGLQKGAGGLQQQMAAQGGEQGQQAQGRGGEQGDQENDEGEDLDPLGRPRQGRGAAQGRDLDVSGGLAARAQQVLQELRRRLGDPTRSQDEQDYLERLLQRY